MSLLIPDPRESVTKTFAAADSRDVLTEQKLEDALVTQLVNLGYERLIFRRESTVEQMEQNFLTLVEELNRDTLTGVDGIFRPLDAPEKRQVLIRVSSKTETEASEFLRAGITLDRTSGGRVSLRMIDMKDWGRNTFQVANQIWDEGNRSSRYDVTILINGLPLLQYELKRPGVKLEDAFIQTLTYKEKAYTGLFAFLQLFVISNGTTTRYYANNRVADLSDKQTFYWTDEDNKRLVDLTKFTQTFLRPQHLIGFLRHRTHQRKMDAKTINIVARPYQHHAVERCIERINTTFSYTKNSADDRRSRNGWVWHTTGSGKTFTAFMLTREIPARTEAHKAILLVDRTDLDNQTVEEFNKFLPGSVDETDSSRALARQLASAANPVIVTTVQKLNNLVGSSRMPAGIKDQKIVFVVDEAHRSSMGEMRTRIERAFPNAMFIGFTGTPIMEENCGAGDFLTSDFFGKPLHKYLIPDAIADQNVLSFHADFINTVQQKEGFVDEDVPGIRRQEILHHPDRIAAITSDIITNWRTRSLGGTHNAILATDSAQMLGLYWEAFKQADHDLNIGAIFTPARDTTEDLYDTIYNEFTDQQNISWFDGSNDPHKAYKKEIAQRLKDGRLDLVIVVDMMLTGFDSPGTNVLYVDKPLKHHNLIQAMSRTNRLHDDRKQHGQVVFYNGAKPIVDAAVRLFSDGRPAENVLARPYSELEEVLAKHVRELRATHATADDLMQEKSETKIADAVKRISGIATTIAEMKRYVQFNWNDLPFTSEEEQQYRGAMLAMRTAQTRPELVSVLNDLEFHLQRIDSSRIDYDYIADLLHKTRTESEKDFRDDTDHIIKEIDKAEPPVSPKSLHIRDFLVHIQTMYTPGISMQEEFDTYTEQQAAVALEALSVEHAVPSDRIGTLAERYELHRDEVELGNGVTKLLAENDHQVGLIARLKKQKNIVTQLINYVERYRTKEQEYIPA